MECIKGLIGEPNNSYPQVKGKMKYIMFPVVLIWFFIQLGLMTGLWICFLSWTSLLMILLSIFEKEHESFHFGIESFIIVFLAPIVWWIRYFKFGEYNILFED